MLTILEELEDILNKLDSIRDRIDIEVTREKKEEKGESQVDRSNVIKLTRNNTGSIIYLLLSEIEAVSDLSSMTGTDTGTVVYSKSGQSYSVIDSAQSVLTVLGFSPD